MVTEIAPVVLEAVAAFMYGTTCLTEAMEAYSRRGLPAAADDEDEQP